MTKQTVTLSLDCKSEEEIRTLYEKLSEGVTVVSELKEAIWGGLFAMIIDRFGVRWMLSLEQQ